MTWTGAKTPQRLGRAQRMQPFSRFALLLFLVRIGGTSGHPLQKGFVRLWCHNGRRRIDGRRWLRWLPLRFVVFFNDVGEHEAVSMAGHRTNEARLSRIVSKHATDCPDGLAQRAVRHDDVGPDAVEDVAPVYGFGPPLDEELKKVEVPGYERLLPPVAQEERLNSLTVFMLINIWGGLFLFAALG
jgi:hypothetical protein